MRNKTKNSSTSSKKWSREEQDAIGIVTGARSYGGPAKEAKRPAVSPSHFTVNVSEVVGAPCYSHQKKSQAVLGMFFLMLLLQFAISFFWRRKKNYITVLVASCAFKCVGHIVPAVCFSV